MNILARFISFVTNPLFVYIPVPFLLVHRFGYGDKQALLWTFFSLFFLVITGAFVLYEVKHKVFSDIDVSTREQRPLLFRVAFVITCLYIFCLYLFHAPPILLITGWSSIIGIITTIIINTRVKASIHIAVLTIFLLTMIPLYRLSYLWLFIIPLVAWARVQIKRHTLLEVSTGCLLGFTLTISIYILLKYIYHFSI